MNNVYVVSFGVNCGPIFEGAFVVRFSLPLLKNSSICPKELGSHADR